jgi:hypothetical protein
MASPYQQQALYRKLVYIVLIAFLFTAAGVYRVFVVEARAEQLSLREQNVGDPEIAGAAMELSLTGSRGFVISALWYWAQEAQKRNRWNELELYAVSLTKLQPHFIAPWLFQTWNLSYNVAVEADQVKDKYFYVTRGVQLLGQGERKNHCNPDMRFNIGFYQQHKVMQSDETNVFRCLYQMSCIPFPERDPERFGPVDAGGRRVIDLAVYEKFCADHPQLVRRLHDRLRCAKPDDVVAFLEDNKDIPSLFVDDPNVARVEWAQGRMPLKDDHLDRFPVLPPPARVRVLELPAAPGARLYDEGEMSYETGLKDEIDAYAVARAWYAYAQDPIPVPDAVLPGITTDIVDRARQRKPRMTTSLFRNHPPRAQSYVAERLQDEGWFGTEGWLITGWFPRDRFPDGREAIVGTQRNWAEASWANAYDWWRRRAEDSHLLNDPQDLTEKRTKGLAYMKSRGLELGGAPPTNEPPKDSPEHEGWFAAKFIYELEYTLRLTNTLNFYHRAAVEKEPESTQQSLLEARRTMFEARQSVRLGQRDKAAELFESKTGLERLRLILERYPDFRRDENNQEAFYEFQVRYVKLMQDKEGGTYKQLMAAGSLLAAGLPQGGPAWPGLVQQALLTDDTMMPRLPVPQFVPPERIRVEGTDKDGNVLVSKGAIYQIQVRHNLIKPNAPPREMTPGMRPPPGAPMPAPADAEIPK